MDDTTASAVVEALYLAAADPEGWREVIDALSDTREEDHPSAGAERAARHALEVARRVVAGEQEAIPAGSQVGRLHVSRSGRILSVNAAAEAALGGALANARGGPEFVDPANATALDAALARLRKQSRVVLRLDLPDAGVCFGYVTSGPAGEAIVTLPGADAVAELWGALSDSFGLTPAEVRVAARFREGQTLRDIAEDLDLSIHTVRNQLRSILEKLGLQRQSELIRTLSGLAPLTPAAAGVDDSAADAPPRLSLTLSDGRHLAYRDYGAPGGRTLVMFHEGLGSSLLPTGADALARRLGVRVVCPERPGFGASSPRADYGFDAVAADIAELCAALDLRQVMFGAILSGAPFAIETAKRLGPQVEEVLLCSGRPPRPARTGATVAARFRRRLEAAPWVAETLYSILRLRLSGPFVRRLIHASTLHAPGDRAFAEANPWAADYIAAYVAEAVDEGVGGVVAELRAFRRGGNATTAGLACPVTVWHGGQDHFAPLDDLLNYLGDHAVEVSVDPDMGHLLGVRRWRDIIHHAAKAGA